MMHLHFVPRNTSRGLPLKRDLRQTTTQNWSNPCDQQPRVCVVPGLAAAGTVPFRFPLSVLAGAQTIRGSGRVKVTMKRDLPR